MPLTHGKLPAVNSKQSAGSLHRPATLEDLLNSEWRIHVALRTTRRRIIAAIRNGLSYDTFNLLNATLVRATRIATKLKALDESTQRQ